jgi:hypothetical protein
MGQYMKIKGDITWFVGMVLFSGHNMGISWDMLGYKQQK